MQDLTDNNMELPANWQELAAPEQAGNKHPAATPRHSVRNPIASTQDAPSLTVSDPFETFHRSAASAGEGPLVRGLNSWEIILLVGALEAIVVLVIWLLQVLRSP